MGVGKEGLLCDTGLFLFKLKGSMTGVLNLLAVPDGVNVNYDGLHFM